MFGAVGARCIAAVRYIIAATLSAAGLMLLLAAWQDDDDSQRQLRAGAEQPMVRAGPEQPVQPVAAVEAQPPRRPAPTPQEIAHAEALARHLRGGPRVADPTQDTPLSAASTIVSPALSDASWELPEAAVGSEAPEHAAERPP
mmetsp:Transcript_19046/g.35724  ORF Transcript_19046/g.35724 Transcript_19046/m.35724 type:complete len:143 (+) Transcript_19046:36-464(+)